MKLRLQSNSIRLRLKRAEVARLAKIGSVEETIVFGNEADETFHCVLESSTTVSNLRATLKKTGVLVQVPAKAVSRWATGDEVGIEASLPVGDGRQLQVLIEKDFACLDGSTEQNSDTFPNPLAETKCKLVNEL
jgi:hypothetical protein